MNRTLTISAITLTFVFSLVLGSAVASAQDEEYAPATEAHRDGRWSLQFQVLDNFNLGSFEGSSIAATKNTSPTGAWRFGVDYGGTVTSVDFSATTSDTLFPPPPGSEQTLSRGLLGVSALRLRRVNPGRRVGVFLGAGPSVYWSHDHQHSTDDQGSSGQSELTRDNTVYSAGISGVLGAEVFVARSISLHAQYGAQFAYQTYKLTNSVRNTSGPPGPAVTESEQTVKAHTWAFNASQVRLGVSVYL